MNTPSPPRRPSPTRAHAAAPSVGLLPLESAGRTARWAGGPRRPPSTGSARPARTWCSASPSRTRSGTRTSAAWRRGTPCGTSATAARCASTPWGATSAGEREGERERDSQGAERHTGRTIENVGRQVGRQAGRQRMAGRLAGRQAGKHAGRQAGR